MTDLGRLICMRNPHLVTTGLHLSIQIIYSKIYQVLAATVLYSEGQKQPNDPARLSHELIEPHTANGQSMKTTKRPALLLVTKT